MVLNGRDINLKFVAVIFVLAMLSPIYFIALFKYSGSKLIYTIFTIIIHWLLVAGFLEKAIFFEAFIKGQMIDRVDCCKIGRCKIIEPGGDEDAQARVQVQGIGQLLRHVNIALPALYARAPVPCFAHVAAQEPVGQVIAYVQLTAQVIIDS